MIERLTPEPDKARQVKGTFISLLQDRFAQAQQDVNARFRTPGQRYSTAADFCSFTAYALMSGLVVLTHSESVCSLGAAGYLSWLFNGSVDKRSEWVTRAEVVIIARPQLHSAASLDGQGSKAVEFDFV